MYSYMSIEYALTADSKRRCAYYAGTITSVYVLFCPAGCCCLSAFGTALFSAALRRVLFYFLHLFHSNLCAWMPDNINTLIFVHPNGTICLVDNSISLWAIKASLAFCILQHLFLHFNSFAKVIRRKEWETIKKIDYL